MTFRMPSGVGLGGFAGEVLAGNGETAGGGFGDGTVGHALAVLQNI